MAIRDSMINIAAITIFVIAIPPFRRVVKKILQKVPEVSILTIDSSAALSTAQSNAWASRRTQTRRIKSHRAATTLPDAKSNPESEEMIMNGSNGTTERNNPHNIRMDSRKNGESLKMTELIVEQHENQSQSCTYREGGDTCMGDQFEVQRGRGGRARRGRGRRGRGRGRRGRARERVQGNIELVQKVEKSDRNDCPREDTMDDQEVVEFVTCVRCGHIGHFATDCTGPFGPLRRSWTIGLQALGRRLRAEAGIPVVWCD